MKVHKINILTISFSLRSVWNLEARQSCSCAASLTKFNLSSLCYKKCRNLRFSTSQILRLLCFFVWDM